MKYSILIVDDQKKVAESVKKELETLYPEHFIIDVMDDKTLLENINMVAYDVYILDIEMPAISGFVAAKELHQNYPEGLLLFLTTHEELSIDGYEYRAFRFLVKKNLKMVLEKTMEAVLIELDNIHTMIEVRNEAKFAVQIPIRDVVCVYSEKNYLILKTEKEIFQVRLSLKEFQKRYALFSFVSPCKGYLVNLMKIASVDCHKDIIYLKHTGIVPISRRRKKEFYKLYAKGA